MAEDTQDKRGAPEGSFGNVPHERSEKAAVLIETLAGFGITQAEIGQAVERQLGEETGQGYSPDTLQRHYRAELDRGQALAKVQLMQKAHQMAMGNAVGFPEGTSPDKKAELSSKKIDFLLRVVHGVGGVELGSGTVHLTISPDDAEL